MRLTRRPGGTAEADADAAPDTPAGDADTAEAGPPRDAVAALALRTAASALALAAAVAVVADRHRLGGRAAWALALVALGVAIVWKRGQRHPPGAWAAWPLAIATAVLATALGRGSGDERALEFDRRVLDLDIAPHAAFLAVSCLALAVAACVALSRVASDEPVEPRRRHRPRSRGAAGVGLAAAVALTGASLAVSAVVRAQVDARAEAASVDHDVDGAAERAADAPGPALPSVEPAWRAPWEPVEERAPVAVPGWDVLLAVDDLGTTLAAISTDDGTTVWRHHREGRVYSVRVDDEAGRVLVVGGRAAVVLDLADGSQVASRRVPGESCAGVPPAVDVAPAALLDCDGGLVTVEAASTTVRGPFELPQDRPGALGECELRSVAGDPATVVRSGTGRCGRPDVLVHDEDAGRVDVLATIEPPGAAGESLGTVETQVDEVRRAAGGLLLLDVRWSGTELEGEIVAVGPDGDVRWRAPTTAGRLVAVTEDAAVTVEPGQWRLLALDDGAELASSPLGVHEYSPEPYDATDGERLYSLSAVRDSLDPQFGTEAPDLVVRNLDDLSIEGTWEDFAPAGTWGLAAAGDRLVFAAGGELVAHGPGTDPPPSTDLPPPFAAAQHGGALRLADSGFTVVPDPATSEDAQPVEHVSVGVVVESTSEQVAEDLSVRMRPVDTDGRPGTPTSTSPPSTPATPG
jgi:hypothetical protein